MSRRLKGEEKGVYGLMVKKNGEAFMFDNMDGKFTDLEYIIKLEKSLGK